MKLWYVEWLHDDGEVDMSSEAYFDLGDAVDEADRHWDRGETCCDKRTSKRDFMDSCPGGCETPSPRVVELRAERVD